MKLTPRFSSKAQITPLPNGWRLDIPAGDTSAYRFAQLDDYTGLPRTRFSSHPPLTLSLRARTSSNSIPGTWGFGLWNDPFGLSLGFGGNPFRLPTPPNAIWFFHASEENWLSFQNPENGRTHRSAPIAGNGFLAQAFRSPRIPSPILASLGLLSLPIVLVNLATRKTRKWLRGLAGRVIGEDGKRLSVDQTHWHSYRFEWSLTRSALWVDDALVLETSVSPRPPLGLVIWLDNQFARFTPEGEIGFGVLKNEAAWLEVEDVLICNAKT
ncbi:MAG: hypothetical protein C4583_14810 [Anaerolineaceae bacterium]|nr:MAG: hypothetical protein C4583_14810 [Anaerolineaceae bacterium]